MSQGVLDAGYARFEDLVSRLHKGNDPQERLAISNAAYQRIIAEISEAFRKRFPDDAPELMREIFRALYNRTGGATAQAVFDFEPGDLASLNTCLKALPQLFVAGASASSLGLTIETSPSPEWLAPVFQGYLSIIMDFVEKFTAEFDDAAWDVLKDVFWEIGVERAEGLVVRFDIRGDDFASLMKVFAFGGSILAAGDKPTTAMEIVERTDKRLVGNVHHCALAEQFSRVEQGSRQANGGMCMVCWDQLDQAAFQRAGAHWKAYEVPKRLAAGDDHCVFVFESE